MPEIKDVTIGTVAVARTIADEGPAIHALSWVVIQRALRDAADEIERLHKLENGYADCPACKLSFRTIDQDGNSRLSPCQ